MPHGHTLAAEPPGLMSVFQVGRRGKSKRPRSKGLKGHFLIRLHVFIQNENCSPEISISLAGTGFHGHLELQERLGKSSFKIVLVSIVGEGKGDRIGMPFGLPVHSFGCRPAKAPRNGGLGEFWDRRSRGGQGSG